jgi:hypothetical protein
MLSVPRLDKDGKFMHSELGFWARVMHVPDRLCPKPFGEKGGELIDRMKLGFVC